MVYFASQIERQVYHIKGGTAMGSMTQLVSL